MMAWPQYTMLFLVILAMGISMARYGQERTGNAARYDLVDVFVAPALTLTLLWCGGFFEGGAKWP